MWIKDFIESLNNLKDPFVKFLVRVVLLLLVIALAFVISLTGYSLLRGKHIKVASKDYGIDSPSITETTKPSVDTSQSQKTAKNSAPVKKVIHLRNAIVTHRKSQISPKTNTGKKIIDTNLKAKNILKGNVSGGNVIVGDNGTINQSEQRHLNDIDKAKLLGKIDNLLLLNHLRKDIKIVLGFPMSSEEAERYALEIGNYLVSEGYNAQRVSPTMGNEDLGFTLRLVDNKTSIQIDVGLKNIGAGKL
jgi:hypothetical protein